MCCFSRAKFASSSSLAVCNVTLPENAERKQELKKFGKVGKIFTDSTSPDQ